MRTDVSLMASSRPMPAVIPGPPRSRTGECLSYGELLERADGIAEGLRREGVRPGDVVAAYVERSTTAVVSLLGIRAPAPRTCRSTRPTRRRATR